MENVVAPRAAAVKAARLAVSSRLTADDIIEATGLPSGTVYPALRRLEGAQCLTSQWEAQEEAEAEGRPSRCYYALTPTGQALLERAVGRFPAIRWTVGGEPFPEPGMA